MSKDNSIKEFLFSFKKKSKLVVSLFLRRIQRIFLSNKLTEVDSYNIPIIINNRNRLTYLLQLITWLEKNNYTNIIILDNDSTFSELLAYYKVTKHRVVYLKANVGYMALWQSQVFNEVKNGFYVYTDPDVIPNPDCPANVVYKLYTVLSNYSQIEKAGVALKLNDLPDSYDKKNDVLSWEKIHWEKQVEKDVYDALVDTTFALYKPLSFGNAEMCKGFRVGGEYEFLHLPWYIDSNNLTEEEKYYRNNVSKTSSYWSSK
ncbi:MAG: glycosyltransferase family 2 protein [Bacteroidota bacterium]|nr:glycosyltransferase family 2 protein [Bacteroidota bacterium]MDP3145215.1 glycosyltransferase family 2 protein [Bacteroidota bacterium]